MIRIGTTGSELARARAAAVEESITELSGLPVRTVSVRCDGDDAAVAELRAALLAGTVDVIVHRCRDLLPPADGVLLAAVTARANPYEALVTASGGLAELPAAARVGTASVRHAAALAQLRPDLTVVASGGDVLAELQRVKSAELAAAVVSAAELERLGLLDESVAVLDPSLLVPAAGQGALAIECRADDRLITVVGQLDDTPTRVAIAAERAVLAGLGLDGDNTGAHASWVGERVLLLTADVAGHLGIDYARVSRSATVDDAAAAERLGAAVADSLLADPEPSQ